jgi:hypothetical protein
MTTAREIRETQAKMGQGVRVYPKMLAIRLFGTGALVCGRRSGGRGSM